MADGDSQHFIELSGVTRSFGELAAVSDLSLSLRHGEFFSLLGPSGCGKTTTLRMIAGFERPNSGAIRITGEDMVNVPPHRRPVNTVFQSYALFSHLNVFDNVAFGLRERRFPRAEIERRVREALALVRLPGYEHRRPRALSGGEQQRVALARAIINEPQLLLLDEPLGALDLKLRRAMQLELKSLQQRLGMTFLYVTHDQEEALTMSDRVGVMSKGKLVQVGTPEQVYDRPATRYVADFVGEANVLEGRLVDRADDRVTLEIGSRQFVTAPTGEGSRSAEKGWLIVRPERIDIAPHREPPRPASNGRSMLLGVVTELFFVGTHRKFVVEVSDQGRLVVTCPNRIGTEQEIAVGDRVQVSWVEADGWVITEGGGT